MPVEEWLPTNVRAAGTERVLAPGQAVFHLADSAAGIYEVLQGQVRWSIPRRDREKALPHARDCAWLWWTEGSRNGNYKRGLYTAEAIGTRR